LCRQARQFVEIEHSLDSLVQRLRSVIDLPENQT
jgi:hypothetical protein